MMSRNIHVAVNLLTGLSPFSLAWLSRRLPIDVSLQAWLAVVQDDPELFVLCVEVDFASPT